MADMHSNKKLTGIIKITAKPMGFVMVDGIKSDDDIVVFEESLNCALDRDEVEVEIVGKDSPRKGFGEAGRDRKKGKITKIIKRNKIKFVGTVEKSGERIVFKPDDWKFYKDIELVGVSPDLESGTKAFVEMLDWSNPSLNPKGQILEIIGKKGEHETEMQSILLDKGIVYNFPPEVEQEAEKVAEEFRRGHNQEKVFSSEKSSGRLSGLNQTFSPEKLFLDYQGNKRADFRDITTFTIDPKDAKDFDDALSYEVLDENTIRVGVHIADVSHFVRPGGALDKEARERSFSTYLVDRTIPMLPEVLSNDLCSLNPNVDRFAFASVFDIEKSTGKILDRWFGKTVINSNKRFSYEEAQELLDTRLPSPDQGEGLHEVRGEVLQELNRIANIYRAENKKNGAIEFETDEVKFELDESGRPIRIYKKARLDTMKMIEEWMLLANREVAKFLSDKLKKRGAGAASIFRIHNLPKMERIEELAVFVRALGHELPIKNGSVTARDINTLLSAIEGHASESLIKTATIRSMAKAVYSTKNIGHFGLAFEYYTHFTSPIRRYPDLMIHRILETHLENKPISKDEMTKFEKIAIEASEKEITVQEAERESIRYKQVEFMKDKVGQEFEAVISGVTEWGMYVENLETKVEGMVRLKEMTDDFYELDQKNYSVVGQRTKKKYSLGDPIRVRLASADLDRKTLDFKLV